MESMHYHYCNYTIIGKNSIRPVKDHELHYPFAILDKS